MDYEWECFMEELKAGRTRIRITEDDAIGARAVMERFPEHKRKELKNVVRNILSCCRQQDDAEKELIQEVVKIHAAYCGSRPDDDILKRRHNSIAYRYMSKNAPANRAVAQRLNVSLSTYLIDCGRAIDDFLIMLFGPAAIPDYPKSWPEALRSLLKNIRLIKHGQQISRNFLCSQYEYDRSCCQEATDRILHSVEKALLMYDEFCDFCIFQDDSVRRPPEIVRAVYFDEVRRPISEIAEQQGVCRETVYADLKKAVGYLSDLLKYMGTFCDISALQRSI